MIGLLNRLRKRKIVQWTLAYGAGAWALLQGLSLLAATYDWPPMLMRVAVGVAVVGFLVTLVLAWYHGERGEQRILRNELALIAFIVLLGGGLLWRTTQAPTPVVAAAPTPTLRLIPTIESDPSIAVLPLVNMSSDKEQEYFSDGISEELLNLLAKVPKLRVIARTSSFAFKGRAVGIPEIARALNVAAILEGSVRKSGNNVRITVQLIRAADNSHLWSEDYDRTLDDIFKVQDEIAAAVVDQLKIKLLGAAPTARPVDPKAYPLILQANALADQGTAAANARAVTLYQQALVIAPEESRAWVGLGRVYMNQASAGQRPVVEGSRLAKEALHKALADDPDNALAYSRLGWLASSLDNDPAAAARNHQNALALDPTHTSVIINAGDFLLKLGRLDEAIALDEYGAIHDPANAFAHTILGGAYYSAGRWNQAIDSYRTALSLSPGRTSAHFTIGVALLLGTRDAAAALQEIQAEPRDTLRMAGVPMALYALGRKAESDAALAVLIAKHGEEEATLIALVAAYRGEPDRSFEWLEKAAATQDPNLPGIATEPLFAKLHKDPRWLPLLRRLGVAPEQLAKIEFKVALPQ